MSIPWGEPRVIEWSVSKIRITPYLSPETRSGSIDELSVIEGSV